MSRLIFGWLTALMASLPLWLGYSLASLFTEVHFRLFPGRRHNALANLAVALPRATRRDRLQVVRRMMRSYNCMLFEFFRLPHLTRRELMESVEVEGREHLEQAVARGRGVILASSHIGNWELGAVMLAHWGYTLHAVAGVQLTRWLTPAVRETKTELAIHTVSPEDGFRRLLRALEHNDLVALMVDGDVYSHGQPVEFFGRETQFPSGPGVLAQRTGALIICGYCDRVARGRFRIVFEPAIDPARFESVQAINAAVARTVERHIRDHIDQWCIFRPMWEGLPQHDALPAGEERSALA
ncbi:MAG TPA: lysophospholipid acyltransferase family protein [Candidatus Udaeobacter sp.]|jgi:KDO2-lipid IV(A) lauroyltransferase|nr:lysophospholipid acyltransferase family protein [Candidatus Udaeobacter sp.]